MAPSRYKISIDNPTFPPASCFTAPPFHSSSLDRHRDMVEEGLTLEYTPTWVVASLCTVIVAISLVAERLLHYTGKLMLLGFISLLLAVFQSRIEKLCISENTAKEWLPCKLTDASSSSSTTTHFQTLFTSFIPGRLLAEATTTAKDYCAEMGNLTAFSASINVTILAIGY
ncbi:mlo-like protein 1 [Quercus suber]|uniref:Mlo-like protein 1 n=1 Tax=Quercus suber TaxID=58331 RepID=A0AAW0JR76_QUESU